MKFDEVQDSGKREEYATGAVRDIQDGKPRFDLIPVEAMNRLAQHYTNGAIKYGDNNWRKGLTDPEWISRCYASALRHLYQYRMDECSEDHLSAVVFNIFCIVTAEENVEKAPIAIQIPGVTTPEWIKKALEDAIPEKIKNEELEEL